MATVTMVTMCHIVQHTVTCDGNTVTIIHFTATTLGRALYGLIRGTGCGDNEDSVNTALDSCKLVNHLLSVWRVVYHLGEKIICSIMIKISQSHILRVNVCFDFIFRSMST